MSSPEINNVLAQMRSLSQELRAPVTEQINQAPNAGFAAAMQEAVENVNVKQGDAANLLTRFETGADDTSVAEVMVAMQKASVSFQAMTEVRNRLVEAYREIMSMPL